jgi:hypothetical protein
MVIRVARFQNARGALRVQACVPPSGSAVQVMQSTVGSLLQVAGEVARLAVNAHPNPRVLLAFSCAARTVILGKRTPEEARLLQAAAGTVPASGVYCCGEFARTAGVLATHNATITAMAL